MKISDILKLTAAGFKASDIKQMIEEEKNEKLEAESVPAEVVEVKAAPETKEEVKPDYEALYKEALKALDETGKKLEAAQAKNLNQTVAEMPSIANEMKKLEDLFRR